MSKYLDLIQRLADAEQEQKQALFIAPITRGGKVRLKVLNVVNTYSLRDKSFEGWAVLRMSGQKSASFVRSPLLKEIREYSSRLANALFVLIDEIDGKWYGLQLGAGQRGIQIEGPVEIKLIEKPAQFRVVHAGFDGQNFWFTGAYNREPRLAEELRRSLASDLPEDKLPFLNLQPAHRTVYKMLLAARKPVSAYDRSGKLSEKERIDLALKQAGARLDSYAAQNQHSATVRFERAGQMHSVTINRDTLEVVSSGICLSGKDRDFDLTSLVGVFNEKDTRADNGREDWDDD